MEKKKVFVTREILPEGLKLLQDNFEVDLWTDYAPPSKEIIKEHIIGIKCRNIGNIFFLYS